MSRRDGDRDHGVERERALQGEVDAHFALRAECWQGVYGERSLWSVILQHRRKVVLAWVDSLRLPSRSLALDVGCGPGFLAIELARRDLVVDAIDRAGPMALLARLNAERDGVSDDVRVMIGDTHALPFRDKTFRLVLAVGVIPWIHSPTRAVLEMTRVLQPGGYLIIQASNSAQMSSLVDHLVAPALVVFRTVRMFLWRHLGRGDYVGTRLKITKHSRDDLDRLLRAAALEKVEATTFGFRPLTLLGRNLVPFGAGLLLHNLLQSFAERDLLALRWAGEQYLVLARRPSDDAIKGADRET